MTQVGGKGEGVVEGRERRSQVCMFTGLNAGCMYKMAKWLPSMCMASTFVVAGNGLNGGGNVGKWRVLREKRS